MANKGPGKWASGGGVDVLETKGKRPAIISQIFWLEVTDAPTRYNFFAVARVGFSLQRTK